MPDESDWLQGCQMLLALSYADDTCSDFVPIKILGGWMGGWV